MGIKKGVRLRISCDSLSTSLYTEPSAACPIAATFINKSVPVVKTNNPHLNNFLLFQIILFPFFKINFIPIILFCDIKSKIVDGDSNKDYAWLGIDRIDAGLAMQINFNANPESKNWELETENKKPKILNYFGVPYLINSGLTFKQNDTRKIELGFKPKKIILFGMTFTPDIGTPLWHYAADFSPRYFIGDELGQIKINYANGTIQEYPLVFGDNLWWGQRFYNYPKPFDSNKQKIKVLKNSLNLFPAKPVQGGGRNGVIEPKTERIISIEFTDRKEKFTTLDLIK